MRVVHLQCHIGTDTISLGRLGAEVTGLDFSSAAQFVEHTSVPWEALPGRMRLDDNGEWSLTDHTERLPLTYTLQAIKAP